jgi:hypothetical protein
MAFIIERACPQRVLNLYFMEPCISRTQATF